MSAELIPFGKYRGQPAEVLLADTDYRDWLVAQPWFRERFVTLYQTVINYGSEPQDSAEHNEMQAAFLDDNLCLRLAAVLLKSEVLAPVSNRSFEAGGWDVWYEVRALTETQSMRGGRWVTDPEPSRWPRKIAVECKPDLGDDFPTVLRQVKRYPSELLDKACVIVRRAAFERVTWEQVAAMFAASKITLLRESDIAGDDE